MESDTDLDALQNRQFRAVVESVARGERKASEDLLPLVYQELRELAAWQLSQEPPGQTLQATALVHEAYLRLVDVDNPQQWDNRRHFFVAAGEAMRRILVEAARRKQSLKHGGAFRRQTMVEAQGAALSSVESLLELDDVLSRLEKVDQDAAELVKLRYFSGFTQKDAAKVLDVPRRSADRLWAYARAWLHRELHGSESSR